MTMNSTVAIPTVRPARRRKVGWWLVPVVVGVALAIAAAVFQPWRSGPDPMAVGQFYTVGPMDLDLIIAKSGELQAIKYIDVECRVEGSSQIIWIVKEGSYVHKGDELVKLDASNLQIRKENVDLDLKKAESNLKISQELKGIQENQNAANREAAEVNLQLARLALQQYEEGTYPQQLENARTSLDMAKITLKNKEEELDQAQKLFVKGFINAAEVKKAQLDHRSAQNELQKADRALAVLQKYTHAMQIAQLKSDVAQADQALQRVLRLNASQLNQRNADLEEKEQALGLYRKQATKLQEQLDACTIIAPEDGLVIYMSTIDRWGREPVQEGANVRYSQSLIRLPDVRNMKVTMRVQESQKVKLNVDGGQRALVQIAGVPEPVGATLSKVSVLPDNSQRWWNPDLKEYPVELVLDHTPPGLKPGTSCDVELLIDRLPGILAVPLAAIYTVGTDSYVFVREQGTVKHRKVKVGVSNETHAEIGAGLSDGEQVLLLQAGQGRLLLEKAGVKTQADAKPEEREFPQTRPAEPRQTQPKAA